MTKSTRHVSWRTTGQLAFSHPSTTRTWVRLQQYVYWQIHLVHPSNESRHQYHYTSILNPCRNSSEGAYRMIHFVRSQLPHAEVHIHHGYQQLRAVGSQLPSENSAHTYWKLSCFRALPDAIVCLSSSCNCSAQGPTPLTASVKFLRPVSDGVVKIEWWRIPCTVQDGLIPSSYETTAMDFCLSSVVEWSSVFSMWPRPGAETGASHREEKSCNTTKIQCDLVGWPLGYGDCLYILYDLSGWSSWTGLVGSIPWIARGTALRFI